MSGPFDSIAQIGALNRANDTPNLNNQPNDHNTFQAKIDGLIAAGISLEALVLYVANDLSDVSHPGVGLKTLGYGAARRAGEMYIPPTLTAYGHSYGAWSGNTWTSSARTLFHARLAQRLGLPLIPPYYYNGHVSGQLIYQTNGTINAGNSSISAWTPGTSSGIVTLDAMRNDGSLYNSNGADTTPYQNELRTILRLLKSTASIEDTSFTKVGTWSRTSDTSFASGGGQAFTSSGDVTTTYASFVATQSEMVVQHTLWDTGVQTDGVLRITDHTASDTVLADVSQFTGGRPSGGTWALNSTRLTGLTVGHEIRMGRKPGTAGTVYIDRVLSPSTEPLCTVIVVKDADLGVWFPSNISVGLANLRTAIDTVCAESEFSFFVKAADPQLHGWVAKTYSSTTETSQRGREGCIGDDASVIHPNDHGQQIYADACEAALATSPWARSFGYQL